MDKKLEMKGKNSTNHMVLSFISGDLAKEIKDISESGALIGRCIEEVRLRAFGMCEIIASGVSIPLSYRVSSEELSSILKRACDMAVFAHRDDICSGFVTASGGIRVGVAGRARYDKGVQVGVDDISSLVLRIPSFECDYADRVYAHWLSSGKSGMLICSRAGVGKTTLIRALASLIGGPNGVRTVVVDERCEFERSLYQDCRVDILSGYKRHLGVDIALRTMSAEVIIVDEISSEKDMAALLPAVGAGVTVIATAHGDNIDGVLKRNYIKELVDSSVFRTYTVIERIGGSHRVKLGRF